MITIIFCGDLQYCPYLKRYSERLDSKKIEYEVLFWNRSGSELNIERNYKYYNRPSKEDKNKAQKLMDFIGFRKWIKSQLNASHPSALIFLSTLTGVLLYDVAEKYSQKYIFDIRDYSYENIPIFQKAEDRIIQNSMFTVISSKGFLNFLPDYDYIIAHNFNRNEINRDYEFKKHKPPLKIIWNGTIRFFDYQKRYLDIFKNDSRFRLIYHGSGVDLEQFKDYCANENIENVEFTGPYNNQDKYNLISQAAYLNNCYGGRSGDQLKYAISNRYYDGLIAHIPQIVESDGYKAEKVKEQSVGLVVEPSHELPDKLFNYYINIDKEDFDEKCASTLEDIIREDDKYIKMIDSFIEKFN